MSVALGNIDFLTILSLSILEYGMCFHLLMFSQVSFRNVLLLLLYRSFTSLVKLVPRYFILFDAILNETVFLISFSSLIGVPRISSTMLNRSGESGHSCLVPDLSGITFSFSPLRMMFAVGLSYMAFIMLR